MKVVKLNRRYRQFRDNGHTIALRFDGWDEIALQYERVARNKLGGHGYYRADSWFSYFGDGRKGPRPYWITFRNEQDATLVLLCAQLTK